MDIIDFHFICHQGARRNPAFFIDMIKQLDSMKIQTEDEWKRDWADEKNN